MCAYQYYYVPAKKFTARELTQLLISLLVLTLAFSFALRWEIGFPLGIVIALPAVATGFLFHELMHKFVAQRYGCWAEYRMFPFGLLLALLVSIAGFVFAAPGAVLIAGSVTQAQNGKINLAGPLTNIGIALAFSALRFVSLPPYLAITVWLVCLVNAFLAFFNLLPVPPLDGSKIFKWSVGSWIAVFLVAVLLLGSVWLLPARL